MMHKKNLRIVAALVVFLTVSLSNTASARLDPVFDIVAAEIVSNTPKNLEAVKKAIIAGGKVRQWRMTEVAPGHLEAVIDVRTHQATVDIIFDELTYSITYRDSVNLKYKDGLIHRNYNKWIRNLDLSIQKSLSY